MKLNHKIMIFLTFLSLNDCIARTYQWANYAKKDLDLMHTTILENHLGPVDKENPHLSDWLERGYVQSMQRAQCVRSYADYKAALQYYVTGLRDMHVELRFNRAVKNYWWPGFIVSYVDGKYKVSFVKESLSKEVPIGSELIAIDGLPVKEFMHSYMMPYMNFTPGLEQKNIKHTHDLFIHDGNQWQQRPSVCSLMIGSEQKTVPLVYSRIHVKTFNKYVSSVEIKESPRIVQNRLFDDRGIVLTKKNLWSLNKKEMIEYEHY